MSYQQLGTQIGELTDQKNAAYGSSFAKSGEFLRLLYPDGIRPEQMEDALLLVRIFDKQMRIATDQDAFGESPFQDIAGYGLLGAQLHQERRKECRTNARAWAASKRPKAKTASVPRPAAKRPTSASSRTKGGASRPARSVALPADSNKRKHPRS